MNPYLEQTDVWQDFHDRFIPALSDILSPQVSPHFFVKIEAHLYIHEPEASEHEPEASERFRLGSADLGILRPEHGPTEVVTGVATMTAPARVILPAVETERHRYLEVRDRRTRDLVAVVEMLSPTNKKPGPDREQYVAKRAALLKGRAHFVEIDLLRGWPRMPMEEASPCDYCVMVSRVDERPGAGFWPIQLRDRLPIIPIPLREPLIEAHVDLQTLLDALYDRAYYRDYIYHGKPSPALRAEDAAWAATLLAKN
jgi:hypothetical protein